MPIGIISDTSLQLIDKLVKFELFIELVGFVGVIVGEGDSDIVGNSSLAGVLIGEQLLINKQAGNTKKNKNLFKMIIPFLPPYIHLFASTG